MLAMLGASLLPGLRHQGRRGESYTMYTVHDYILTCVSLPVPYCATLRAPLMNTLSGPR